MMPIGSLLGGVVVAVVEPAFGREWALRWPFLLAGGMTLALYMYALPRLNSKKIDEAKAAAVSPEASSAPGDPADLDSSG